MQGGCAIWGFGFSSSTLPIFYSNKTASFLTGYTFKGSILETLGEYLKNQREVRNITLEEVAKVTKIRKAILKAIESDRHDLLPSRVFAQGFLKIYATYLGLDESEVVKRYQEALEGMEIEEDKGESKEQKPPKRVLSPARILVLFTIVVLAIAFWFFLFPRGEKRIIILKNNQQKSTTESIKPLSVAKPEILGEKGEVKVIREEKKLDFLDEGADRNGLQEEGEVDADQMALRVLATETTWIKFQLDQDEPFEVLLRSGESFRVKASEKFNLRIGNAGGVELFLNGKPLGNPGKNGEVIDLTLPE